MRLRDLEIFHAVLQAGSVTGAARLLHISQPAASKALQQVERQWGITLFTRSAGQLHPTEEARKLEAASQGMLGQLDDVRRLVDGLREGEARTLKVVATPAIAQQLLPQALGQWRRRQPRVSCELATQHTREIVDALLEANANVWKRFRLKPDAVESGWSEECRWGRHFLCGG